MSDHSNHSVSGVYDFLAGAYDERALAAFGLDPAHLPGFTDSSAIVGETRAEVFGAEVPVAALAGDQHAAMYGLACLAPGSVKLSLGTSGMMDLNAGTSLAAPGPGAYPLVLWSLNGVRTFCFEGNTITAGAAAQWLRDGLGLVEVARRARAARALGAVERRGLGDPGAAGPRHAAPRRERARHDRRAVARLDARPTSRAPSSRASRGAAARSSRRSPRARRRDRRPCASTAAPRATRCSSDRSPTPRASPCERPAVVESAALGAALLAGRAVGLWRDERRRRRASASSARSSRSLGPDERAERLDRWRKRIALSREAGS